MRTIIQKIGPLYGEVVNGTVFGQPNGSVYYQPNQIKLHEDKRSTYGYLKNRTTAVSTVDSAGNYGTALIFDTIISVAGPYSFKVEIADSAAFTNILTSVLQVASPAFEGSLTNYGLLSGVGLSSELTVAAGVTYYLRVGVLWEGTIICYSGVYEFEGLV